MAAGFPDPQEAIGISVLIQCWSLLCVVVALLLVERVGRKPLLLVGVSAMALGHLVLALFFLKGTVGPIVPAVLILTTGMSNISISPMAWVILAEIFPTRIRGKGMAVATFCLFLASFGVTQLFPVADDYFKSHYGNPSGVFLLFAIICAVGGGLDGVDGARDQGQDPGGDRQLLAPQRQGAWRTHRVIPLGLEYTSNDHDSQCLDWALEEDVGEPEAFEYLANHCTDAGRDGTSGGELQS